jgi:hypothetical protein
MSKNQILFSILLLSSLTCNKVTAMNKNDWEKVYDSLIDWKKVYDGLIVEPDKNGMPSVRYPASHKHPYNTDPELYEREFKDSLRIELYLSKKYGKSEELLKNQEKSLMCSLQQQKQEIIQRLEEQKATNK